MAGQSLNLKLNLTPTMDVKAINTMLTQLKNAMGKAGDSIKLIDEKKYAAEMDKIEREARKAAAEYDKIFNSAAKINDEIIKQGKAAERLAEQGLREARIEAEKLAAELKDSLGGQTFKTANEYAKAFDKTLRQTKKTLEQQQKALHVMKEAGKTGTEEYKKLEKEIGDTEKQLRKLKSATEKIKFDVNAKGATTETKKFGSVLGNVISQGGMLTKAFAFTQVAQSMQLVSGALASFTDPFIELDKQVQNIGTLGVKNFKEFSDLSVRLASSVPDSAATIAQGVYQAISAGMQGTNQEIMEFVEVAAKAGVAGLATTEESVNALTSVMNAYGMQASEAQTVSNTFFAAIKLGKTSFGELNQALANVIPAASAAGVEFDEVAAMIAQMTALGVPTAQASTQIRQAIVELQKPGKALADVMKNVTVEIDGVKQKLTESNMAAVLEKQGLTATLQNIQGAAKDMGLSMTQVMSSSEAASAALLVTGDNAKRASATLAGVRNEIIDNAAVGAYEAAADGIGVQIEIMKNKVQALFSGLFETVGSGVTTTLGAFQQLGPALTSLASLGTLFPVGKVKEFALSLLGKLIPSIVATDVATKTTTFSLKAMSTAMLTTPWGIAITAAVALGAAFFALHKSAEELAEEQLEEAQAMETSAKKKIEVNKRNQELSKSNTDLIKNYEDLNKEYQKTGKKTEEYDKTLRRLAKAYPGVIDEQKPYKENVEALRKAQGELTDEQKKQIEQNKKLITEYEQLGNKSERTKEEQQRYEEVIQKLNKEYPGIIGNTGSFSDEIARLKDESQYATGEMIKLRAEMNKLSKESQVATRNRISAQANNLRVGIDTVIEDVISGNGKEMNVKEVVGKFVDAMYKETTSSGVEDVKNKLINFIWNPKGTDISMIKNISEKEAEKYRFWISQIFNPKNGALESGKSYDEIIAQIEKFVEQRNNVLRYRPNNKEGLGAEIVESTKAQIKKANTDSELETILRNFNAKLITMLSGDKFVDLRENLTGQIQGIIDGRRQQIEQEKSAADAGKKSNDETRSAIQNAALLYKQKASLIKQEQKQGDLEQANLRRASGRKKNDYDALQIQQRALEASKKQLKAFEDAYHVTKGKDGTVSLGLTVDDKDKDKIPELIGTFQDLQNSVMEAEGKIKETKFELGIKVDEKDVSDAKNKLMTLETAFYEGGMDGDEYYSQVSDMLLSVKDKLKANQNTKLELETNLSSVLDDSKEAEKIKKSLSDLEEDTNKALEDEAAIYDVLNKRAEIQAELAEKAKEEHLESLRASAEYENKLNNISIGVTMRVSQDVNDRQEDNELSKLEEKKEQELITEEEYDKKREEIEDKHEKIRSMLDAVQKGVGIEAERQHQAKLLKIKADALKKERFIADEKIKKLKELIQKETDPEEKKKLQAKLNATLNSRTLIDAELNATNKALETKGDLLKGNAEALQEGITEIFSSTGDPEAMKESWREMFGVLAGGLKTYASGIVTKLVIGQLGIDASGGLASLVLIPAITGLVNAAMSAILSPILSGLASFSTGGKVTDPTVAVVGDNDYSPEWILRDFDIVAIVAEQTKQFTSIMESSLDRYFRKSDISQQNMMDWVKVMQGEIADLPATFKDLQAASISIATGLFKENNLRINSVLARQVENQRLYMNEMEKIYSHFLKFGITPGILRKILEEKVVKKQLSDKQKAGLLTKEDFNRKMDQLSGIQKSIFRELRDGGKLSENNFRMLTASLKNEMKEIRITGFDQLKSSGDQFLSRLDTISRSMAINKDETEKSLNIITQEQRTAFDNEQIYQLIDAINSAGNEINIRLDKIIYAIESLPAYVQIDSNDITDEVNRRNRERKFRKRV